MKSLRIKNFKCFLDKEIEFSNLTVLAGENGAGKSTVIQSLLLFAQNFLKDPILQYPKKLYLNSYYCELGSVKRLLNYNAADELIEFTFRDFNDNKIHFITAEDEKDFYVLEVKSVNKGFKNALSQTIHHALSFVNFFDFIGADRLGPRSFHHTDNNLSRLKVGRYGEYTALVLEKYKLLPLKNYKSDLLDTVNYWLSEIFGYIKIETSCIEEANIAMLKMKNHEDREQSLPAESPLNMPYGVSYVLPIIASCLIRLIPREKLFENYSETEILHEDKLEISEDEMIVIENPEAHLHPKAQSKLGYFLAHMSNYMQIIVETHSEHIINGIRLATLEDSIDQKNICINFFETNEENFEPNIINIKIDEMGDLSDWPKGFFDQQALDVGQIFRAKAMKNVSK